MRRSVKAEAHQAEDSDYNTIYFIQTPCLSKQPVRRLVKANQHSVHEMARGQYERDTEPDRTKIKGGRQGSLIQKEYSHKDREGRTAHPMRWRRFEQVFCRWGWVHHVRVIRAAIRRSGERHASASTARKVYDRFSISARGNRFCRKSHATSRPYSAPVISQPR